MAETESKTRNLLKPVIGGLILIGAIVAIIAFRTQLWDLLKSWGKEGGNALLNWVPNHPGATLVIVVSMLVAFAINWVAHVRGRVRAWIFAVVVEAGLWVLFWNSLGIPSLNELFGINTEKITANEQVISGIVIIILSGLTFWFLEAREEWNKYRRRHNPDDD
jgi:uncharacterized membrane protein YpjA